MSNWNDDQGNENGNGGHAAPPPQSPPAPTPPPAPPRGQWSPSGGTGASAPPSEPGRFVLGPLTVADILDTTFNLFRACWKQLSIAVLVFAVPAGVVAGIANAAENNHNVGVSTGVFASLSDYAKSGSHLSSASAATVIVATVISVALSLFLAPYVNGAITRIVAAKYLGRDIEAKEAFRGVNKLWLRFVGASLLVGLSTIAGLIGFIVGAIAISILFTAVIPIIAIEEETVFNAMGRSWALMKRRFWGYLGIRILMIIVAGFMSLIVEIVPIILSVICYSIGIGPVGAFFLAIGQIFGNLVALPFTAITVTLIYFDARVRNEGFDLQMMAARMPQDPQ